MYSRPLKLLVAIIFLLNITIGYAYAMGNYTPSDQINHSIVLVANQPYAVVNGSKISIGNDTQIAPVIKDNTTLIPVRFIAQSLGATVNWDGTDKKVTISKDSTQVELFIGKTTANVNGTTTTIDFAPQIINDRTYLPVETTSSLLGSQVTSKDRIIVISDKAIELKDEEALYLEGYFNGANDLIEKIKTATNVTDALAVIDNGEITKYDVASLNRILSSVDETAFIYDDKARLKREIIRQYGFSNFDWKNTLDDVKAFTNLGIEVIKLQDPSTFYRRGYTGEPTSKYGLGRWWGDKPRTIEQTRNELAVLENWGNPLTGEYQIVAPSGTLELKGTAAPQVYRNASGEVTETRPGGGMQYFFNSVDNAWLMN